MQKRWGEFNAEERGQLGTLVYGMLSEVGSAPQPEPWMIKSKVATLMAAGPNVAPVVPFPSQLKHRQLNSSTDQT